jgi:hypothetical protein
LEAAMKDNEAGDVVLRLTAQRERRLEKAALLLPGRIRRPAEKPGPRRVLCPEEVLEKFLDSRNDGIVEWARRRARRVTPAR